LYLRGHSRRSLTKSTPGLSTPPAIGPHSHTDHTMLKIPVTMAHGIDPLSTDPWLNLTKPHFEDLIRTAHEMRFTSIDYDQLDAWRNGNGTLPDRPILIDFDHPMRSMRYEVHDVLSAYGYRANLFVNTGMLDKIHSSLYPPDSKLQIMTWDELRQLRDLGWHIGSHTVTHPSLSKLGVEDPSGLRIRRELEDCDARLKAELGIVSKDFAFTGTSWSKVAEDEVAKRYRFGRLWIINSEYDADGKRIRFAQLAGMEDQPDEPDGGPPMASRYITKNTHAYRLPSVEVQSTLIATVGLFKKYLEGALH
jgi:peptidoglycan/xylan/chitin deacetylase (PgdA/CDA1 family)